jgi:hypothetical protein
MVGVLFVPSITHGEKLPVSNPPLTITLDVQAGVAVAVLVAPTVLVRVGVLVIACVGVAEGVVHGTSRYRWLVVVPVNGVPPTA